jgi:hypothetical protein
MKTPVSARFSAKLSAPMVMLCWTAAESRRLCWLNSQRNQQNADADLAARDFSMALLIPFT